jgi:HD-like signal output (HDOD) protein
MKQRSLLTASQLLELHEFLGRRLDAIGIESQPEVVLRLLEISKNPDAQLKDYAGVIKTDHAISGRVLKLANSAMFAQRSAVSSLERGCTLLGIERLKAVSLGFHLSRAASAKDTTTREIARKVWGHSVFRACMAAEAARLTAPGLIAEAFVIGLMMDAGIPLAAKIQGDSYIGVFNECATPGKLFRREFDSLPFTHIDVMSVLSRKWRFPDLLTKPIELHHTRPADNAKDEPVNRLHRIAYVVGLLELDQHDLTNASLMGAAETGGMLTAQRLLRAGDQEMSRVISSSVAEYRVMIDVFSEVASGLVNIEELATRVQNSLINCIDDQIIESMARDGSRIPGQAADAPLIIANSKVEIILEPDGSIVAFVTDSEGRRVVSHRLAKTGETAHTVCESLGLEPPSTEDAQKITNRILALAA